MAFEAYGVTSSDTTKKSTVNWEAMNQYVIETAGLQQPETLSGVISVLVDLGTQKQPDSQWDLDKEDKDLSIEELNEKYADEIEKYGIYFAEGYTKTGKAILKHVPQKDRQSVAFAVDFPDIIIDKGQFFKDSDGNFESNPKPLRLWMGGQFYNGSGMVVQNMTPLKLTKDDKIGWTMSPRSTVYKMAVASKVISAGEAFLPQNIDSLVGKTLQFEARVFMKQAKNGKSYYTEQIKFVGGLPRGSKDLEIDNTYVIEFNGENDLTSLKELRGHIVNTIKCATNFEGSPIQRQLSQVESERGSGSSVDGSDDTSSGDDPTSNGGTKTNKGKQSKVTEPSDDDLF